MRNLIFLLIVLCSINNFSQVKHDDGSYKEYYKSGSLKTEGFYKNNNKFSVWKDYYESGQLKKVYTFNNYGKPTGIEQTFSKTGNLLSERTLASSGGLLYKHYYDNGNLQVVYVSIPSENKTYFIKNGGLKEYYENGVLEIESSYEGNKLSGLWKHFYDTGDKEWEVQYINDLKQGLYKRFYKNGQLMIEGTCSEGLKNGEEKQYDSIGNLVITLNYKKGKLKKVKNQIGFEEIEIPDGDIEKVPVYPGCEGLLTNQEKKQCMSDKISGFVAEKFDTSIAGFLGLTGRQRINVIFKIDKEGRVIDVRSRAPFKELEAEAVRVISALPKMKPGMQFGKAVTVPYSLPIIFNVTTKVKLPITSYDTHSVNKKF
jgi:antitoxin component YwqK of YwqJK toxin-antitoxin module